MCHKIGLPPISIIGFGFKPVSSDNRVPKPPARITVFMNYLILFFWRKRIAPHAQLHKLQLIGGPPVLIIASVLSFLPASFSATNIESTIAFNQCIYYVRLLFQLTFDETTIDIGNPEKSMRPNFVLTSSSKSNKNANTVQITIKFRTYNQE